MFLRTIKKAGTLLAAVLDTADFGDFVDLSFEENCQQMEVLLVYYVQIYSLTSEKFVSRYVL